MTSSIPCSRAWLLLLLIACISTIVSSQEVSPSTTTTATTTICQGKRQRRAWRDLSPTEQQHYLDAIHRLKASGVYDDFVWTHIVNDQWAHGLPEFLPWHRWFIHQFETEVQKVMGGDCTMTLPYWDWEHEVDVSDPAASPLLEPQAFGGFVGRHPFDHTTAELHSHQRQTGCNWPILSTSGTWDGCLERDYDPRYQFWGESQVLAMIADYTQFGDSGFAAAGDFSGGQGPGMHPDDPENHWLDDINGFRIALEGGPHAAPHNFLGGVMPGMTSPNDPLFFVHHSNVDRIWAMWQDYHGHSWLLEDGALLEDAMNMNTTDLTHYEGPGLDRPMPFEAPDVGVDFNWIGPVENGEDADFPTPRQVLNNNDPDGIQVQYVHRGSRHVIPGHCPHPDWFRTSSTAYSSVNLPNMPSVSACQRDEGEQGRRQVLRGSLLEIVEQRQYADLEQVSADVSILYCQTELNTFQGEKAQQRWNELCEELPMTATIPERLTWMALEDCEERGNPKSGSLPWIQKVLGELAKQEQLVSQMELATECFHIPDDILF